MVVSINEGSRWYHPLKKSISPGKKKQYPAIGVALFMETPTFQLEGCFSCVMETRIQPSLENASVHVQL